MQLDQQMLLCFWGKEAVCVNDKLSRTFLRCLPPRDRMRLLGLVSWQPQAGQADICRSACGCYFWRPCLLRQWHCVS